MKEKDIHEITDFTLIAHFIDGDEQSFDTLVHRYESRVLSLCYRYLHDYHEAQDCMQETFFKVYKKVHNFKQQSAFSTWLFTVTVNTCKNRLKWFNVRRFFKTISLNQKMYDNNSDELIQFITDQRTPEKIVELREMHEKIRKCMNMLNAEQRMVIHLKDKEGLKYKEISNITGYSLSKIKTMIHRARLKIAEKISVEYGEDQ